MATTNKAAADKADRAALVLMWVKAVDMLRAIEARANAYGLDSDEKVLLRNCIEELDTGRPRLDLDIFG